MKHRQVAYAVAFLLLLASALSPGVMAGVEEDMKVPKEFKVGLISQGLSTPYCRAIVNGALEESKGTPIQVIVLDGQFDAARQINHMESLIAQKVDLIILHPQESEALVPSVKRAIAAGIPVFTVSLDVFTPVTARIVFNQKDIGYLAGKLLAKALNGKGNIVVIEAPPGTSGKIDRDEGFERALKEHPGLKVIDRYPAFWMRDKAVPVMENFLSRHPKIDGVFAHNEDMAFGALVAIKEAGKLSQIKVVGGDGAEEAFESIRKGELYGTVVCPPYDMGKEAIRLAYYLLSQTNKAAWKGLEGRTWFKLYTVDQTDVHKYPKGTGF